MISEYISRQLRYHQHRITSEIGISLKIVPNYSKLFLKVSQYHLFQVSFSIIWCPLRIFCGARCAHFTIPSGRGGAFLLMRGQMQTFDMTSQNLLFSIILLYLGNSSKKQNIELRTAQTKNSTVLWAL